MTTPKFISDPLLSLLEGSKIFYLSCPRTSSNLSQCPHPRLYGTEGWDGADYTARDKKSLRSKNLGPGNSISEATVRLELHAEGKDGLQAARTSHTLQVILKYTGPGTVLRWDG